ncbi:alcohol dehydrogenase GroES domain-containing protein [[Clostridium] cellulosi]|uniref:Alcohol dehydrogenase GroES domain-containing protein n=1 Tax=[Clostridium] cellulosi TaxID=29343 RepID=A0A078KKX1_9FIRM|nr:alcohol dehydrogenase GroES domain-containing protein [[Clostridium] cellulosi]
MSIPKTMKALVAYGRGDYRFEPAYPTPECGPDDIILKVEGCGVCAGDLKCQHGADMFWGGNGQPSWVEPPFIPGHEFIGIVAEVGENVKGVQVGDRLTADQIYPCGECRFCKSGKYWMCQPHKTFGFFASTNGGMAEYMRLPKNAVVHKVPKDLALEKALLIEPYSCAKHCVDRADIGAEDVVVISGAARSDLAWLHTPASATPSFLLRLI